MLRFFAFLFCLVGAMDNYSPQYFCAEMKHQQIVDVYQLMGLWYGIEIIDHQDERRYVRSSPTCTTLRITESHPSSTTPHPLYKNNQPYGAAYGYSSRRPKTNQQYNRDPYREEYYTGASYDTDQLNGRLHDLQNPDIAFRYLRLSWEDDRDIIEYNVRYNITSPGFWTSSGPEKGVPLKSIYRYHAGNIQVMKEVGNHIVLTFCHRVPEHQLFTMLLSRDPKLDNVEIFNVHRLLNNRNLNTHAIEKMCGNGSNKLLACSYLGIFLVALFIY